MIFNSDTPKKIDAALDDVATWDGRTSMRVAEAFELIRTIEAALQLTQRSAINPVMAGWPPEVAEELRGLRDREEKALATLRKLCVLRALERDTKARSRLTGEIREHLQIMRRCARRESFLYLESFWSDIGESSPQQE